jgi:type I restriction enzyme, S subunit
MNPELLLTHFDRISNAPDAIPRLRRLVLDIAVRGKLTEQDPNDEAASEFLERIRAEKVRLLKEGSARKERLRPPLPADEPPFPIPPAWRWSNLAEVGFINPRNNANDDVQASFVPMSLISAQYGVASSYEVRTWGEIKNGFTHFAVGDVALAKITPCFENGKSAVFSDLAGGIGAGTTELHIVRPILVNPVYVLIFLKCPHFVESGIPRMTGTAGQKRVSTEYFAYSLFPLPPLAEQNRIVTKVNELMGLCDRLETAHAERESRRDRLAAASLHHLTNGADAETARKQAQFCLGHLPQIAIRPEHIPALRQAILGLAVQGKLVQQDPEDDSPESLLSSVREIREKAANRSKNSSVDDSDPKFVQHLPKNLPHRWVSCPLEELFRFIDYRGRTPTRTPRGVRLITAKNVRMGYIANDPVEFIDERAYKAWMTRGFPQNGDLLFVTEGATMGFVGTIDLQFVFALAQRTIDLQPYLPSYSRFFFYTLMSPIFQEAVLTNSTGTAVKGIKAAKLKRIRVPLPPLAEQQRIVAKVNALMDVCHQLVAELAATQTGSRRLLEVALHDALSPTQADPQTAEPHSLGSEFSSAARKPALIT